MRHRLFALAMGLVVVSGCLAGDGERSARLELDQENAEASPLEGDGENCLALTPEEGASFTRVEARADWDDQVPNPEQLSLVLHEVEGGTDHDEATGGPGIAVTGEAIDSRINLAVELPEDSSASAENLTVELSYSLDGSLASAARATCEV